MEHAQVEDSKSKRIDSASTAYSAVADWPHGFTGTVHGTSTQEA